MSFKQYDIEILGFNEKILDVNQLILYDAFNYSPIINFVYHIECILKSF